MLFSYCLLLSCLVNVTVHQILMPYLYILKNVSHLFVLFLLFKIIFRKCVGTRGSDLRGCSKAFAISDPWP